MAAVKGKQAMAMPNPSVGSANPSASMSALWGYIQPALDHIVRSPTNDSTKAPPIEASYHMGIHTSTYNYFTNQSETANVRPAEGDNRVKSVVSGTDLYEQLDKYYADVAREALLGAPQDDSTLIHYIVPCFSRYSTGAHSVHRLLNYVNRHVVRQAMDEDRGWLRLKDVLESVARTITADDTREKVSNKMKERRIDELKKWGYVDGGSTELMAQAEACAEAASAPDRIISLSSLAFRRFRTEFFEPLLAIPKVKGKSKAKNRKPPPSNGDKLGPKGRLARAVKELLESKGGNEEERRKLVGDLAVALKTCGIRADHPLRKRLDKFIAL